MLCLSLESPLRKGCIYLIESRPFQMLSLLLVVSSSVILGLYDPLASTARMRCSVRRGSSAACRCARVAAGTLSGRPRTPAAARLRGWVRGQQYL